ncbi:MAG: hypothetical protein JNL32_12310 [Candidatus Kapabacteria bacterium]|nr:hypothetical protein [Candidatus Kapabacteria bacterium]
MDSLPLGTFIIKSGRRFVDTTYVYKSSVATILLKAYSWIYMIYNNYPEHNLDRNHNVGLWNENDKAFFYDYSRTNFNKYDHGGNESDSESVEFNSHHHYKAMHEKLKAWIPLFWNFGLESMRLKKISPLVDGVYPKLFSSTDKELNTRLLEAIARDSTMSQAEKDEWLPTKVNCLDSMRSNMPRR